MKKSAQASSTSCGTGTGTGTTPVAVRYTCGTADASPNSPIADEGHSLATGASLRVDSDTCEDPGDSDMTKVRPPSARWARAEELCHALHDLTPVKDLVFRLGKSRGLTQSASAPLCTDSLSVSGAGVTTETTTISSATSMPHSPATPLRTGTPPRTSTPPDASPEPDRWSRISELKGRISRTVGGKLNDLRSERMLSRHGSKLSTPTASETISEEEILHELQLVTADDAGGGDLEHLPEDVDSTASSLVAPTTDDAAASGLYTPPDIGFRSVATPVLPTSDGAPATGGVRRDFSLAGIRPLIYARLQRRRRTAPSTETDTPPHSPPTDLTPGTISLSSLQTKYGREEAASEDEEAEEALTLLEVSRPQGRSAGETVRNRWMSVLSQLGSRLLSLLSWKLILLLLAVVLAVPCADFGRGLLIGSSLSVVSCWWLFRVFGFAGRKNSSCCVHGRTPVCRHLANPGPQEFVETPVYKGWMHELEGTQYESGSSHLNTSPVYVRIEGDLLRVTRYKGRLGRRAVWNETLPMVPFGEQRIYDISGADVRCLPATLHHTKVWARRYPICIGLARPAGRYLTHGIVSCSPSSPSDDLSSSDDQGIRSSSVQLHLFARTDRDKEEWYRRFKAAAEITPATTPPSSPTEDHATVESSSLPTAPPPPTTTIPLNFDCYMLHLLPSTNQVTDESHVAWFNSLIGRLVFDLIQDASACEFVQRLVQKKLSKIKLPYFIGELRVISCALGSAAPRLTSVDRVYCDERGLWLHMGVHYDGGASVTLCSRLNLIKLTSQQEHQTDGESVTEVQHQQISENELSSTAPCTYEQQDDDTPESSSDEESVPSPAPGYSSINQADAGSDMADGTSTQVGRRLLKVVDRVTSSRYFKQAAQISYVKKKMEDVSNTPIELSVHLLQLNGTMCINVPPSPSDRLWYGFVTEPCVQISAQPRLGTRDVTMSHVTDWITSSLVLEMKKLLVLPNMDDLEIPFLREHNVSPLGFAGKHSQYCAKDVPSRS